MNFNNLIAVFFCFIAVTFMSCTKEVPPELLSNKQKTTEKSKMPDDSIHRNLMPQDKVHSSQENTDTKSGGDKENWNDEGASKYTKEADEADTKFVKSKSEKDKMECIAKQMKAANYLMFEADLPPKEKYKPALQRYRRVLELDPKNEEATVNKMQIEDIYRSMGKPIPN